MARNLIFLILIVVCAGGHTSFAAEDAQPITYDFLLQDSPAQLFTMRQVNQNYLSGYRLFTRTLESALPQSKIGEKSSNLVQIAFLSFFLMPLTHEEGHRSILTGANIGSISQPYFNKDGAAYVKGVSDATLENLRDKDLPTFIRLHTGGLESDFMLTRCVETLASFAMDDFQHYKWEYWMRKFAIMQYYLSGLLHLEFNLHEESNELNRDIVGHDIYGAARHLYRPDMRYYRYTSFARLTSEEQSYVKKVGYRSFLNLLNPLLIGKTKLVAMPNLSLNAGLAHAMSPFGDFIDENFWLHHQAFDLHVYARQYQNKENWFAAGGLSVNNVDVTARLQMDAVLHFWQQPQDFDFHTSEALTGGAAELHAKYFFYQSKELWLQAASVNIGLIYKTKGFLPEELYLNEHFGFQIGTSLVF